MGLKMKRKQKNMSEETGITFEDIEQKASITPDVVAMRCTEYEFAGKKLAPMTKSRATAARCLGCKIFLGTAERAANGTWPEIFLDAQIVVWLCTVDESRVRRACYKPAGAIDEIFDWWESVGGMPGSDLEAELLTVMFSIITDIETVSADTDSSGRKSSNSDNLGE